jgi:hypothetical protein
MLQTESARASSTHIVASHEESDAVRPPAILLGVDLGPVGDAADDALDGDGAAVEHAFAHGLLTHEVGQDSRVRGEAGDGDPDVVVDADQLLLVGRQLAR